VQASFHALLHGLWHAEDIVLSVNSGAVDNAVVNMQLSAMSEEMLNSATFEDEVVNDASNAVSAAAEGIVLQLTVDDDPVYNNNSLISSVTVDSVLTTSSACLTKYQRNLSSSLLKKIRSGRIGSRQTVSDVAAAQAEVFRKYLLDGDMQARILELDNASIQQVFNGKLCMMVYINFENCITYLVCGSSGKLMSEL